MKYLVTKIHIKPITKEEFHHLVEHLHHLELPYPSYIHQLPNGFMIENEDVIAYHLVLDATYDYIYHQKESCVFISIDAHFKYSFVSLYQELIKQGFYTPSPLFDKEILNLEDYEIFKQTSKDLPIIYLHQSYQHVSFINELKDELAGMANVVCGNQEFEKAYFLDQGHNGSHILLPNGDTYRISRLSKETMVQFIERILYRVQSYLTKRVFPYPYKMNELYQRVLHQMIQNESSLEVTKHLEYRLSDLEGKIQDREKQIEELTQEIYYKNYQVETLENRLTDQDMYPLLLKGDIEEHYIYEQKDMVLAILEEELKREPELLDLFTQILQENSYEVKRDKLPTKPELRNRSELLELVEEVLSYKQIERMMEAFKSELNSYVEKSGHYTVHLFHDDQCPLTIAGSASDMNFIHQMRRIIKRVFF